MIEARAPAPRDDRRPAAAAPPHRARAARRDRPRVRPLRAAATRGSGRGSTAPARRSGARSPSLSDDDGDDSWSQRAVRQPFIWYGNAFLRITAAISRRQEFAADALRRPPRRPRRLRRDAAARRTPTRPAFDALLGERGRRRSSTRAGGRRSADGFRRVHRARRRSSEAAAEHLERELHEGETDPYDSHPSLAERIAAIAGRAEPASPDDSPLRDRAAARPGRRSSARMLAVPARRPDAAELAPGRLGRGRRRGLPRARARRWRGSSRDVARGRHGRRACADAWSQRPRPTWPARCSSASPSWRSSTARDFAAALIGRRRCWSRSQRRRLVGRGRRPPSRSRAPPRRATTIAPCTSSRAARAAGAGELVRAARAWRRSSAIARRSSSPRQLAASDRREAAARLRTTKAPGRHPGPSLQPAGL